MPLDVIGWPEALTVTVLTERIFGQATESRMRSVRRAAQRLWDDEHIDMLAHRRSTGHIHWRRAHVVNDLTEFGIPGRGYSVPAHLYGGSASAYRRVVRPDEEEESQRRQEESQRRVREALALLGVLRLA
jgi:hypothetical protein